MIAALTLKKLMFWIVLLIRILGFNENGQNILKELKDNANIYTNIKEGINNTFDFEIKIAKTLDLIYHTNFTKQEITKPIIKRAN